MTGTLGLFSLVDLFQLLSSSSRTGRLAVEHPAAFAKVYFDRGQVVHAEFGEIAGVDAIYALFDDEQGDFEFTVGLPAPRKTIALSTENLVLEAIRRLDESRRDSGEEDVPPSAVPQLTDRNADELTLMPNENDVLRHVDGTRNVSQIALDAGLQPEDVVGVIGRLIRVGVLRLRSKPPRTARLVTRLTSKRMAKDCVGIDVGILRTWQRALGYPPARVACKKADGKILTLPVQPIEGAGPYMHVTREVLFREGLAADETLLVKPVATPDRP